MDVREFLLRLIRYVILWICAAKAMAGTTDPSTPDSKYLEFGKSFPFVVQLRNKPTEPNPKPGAKCLQTASAVLIHDHWALTAAHVVEDASDNVVVVNAKEYALPHVVWHRDYDNKKVGFHDIAIGYSPKPFKLSFYPALYRNTDEVDKAATIAGFGTHGTFLTGACNMDDFRRAGHNKIENAFNSVLLCSPSRTGKFPLEFGITPGDSGGGLFIGNELAGINSFLMAEDGNPNGSYGDDSAFTRVSMYVDWVDLQIQNYQAALQGRATTGADIRDIPVVK